MHTEEYLYNRKELLKRKTSPYRFSNKPLSEEFYSRFHVEYPDSVYLECFGMQYVCYDNRAVKKLKKMIEDELEKTLKKAAEYKCLISNLETII